jgi:two-component system nitrogen regulation response regulator GlnG
MSRVLVIDDEAAIGWSLREMLGDEGHAVDLAANVVEGLAAAARHAPDVILLDVRLPGRDGIDAIPDLRSVVAAAPIVVMTAFGDLGTAVRAVRAGAFDFLVKPFQLDHVAEVIARGIAAGRAGAAARAADAPPATLVGSSPAMLAVFKRIAVIAACDRPALVTGPAGSGKTLVARAIHDHSSRRDGPFVATNLEALAPAARGDELFAPGIGLCDRAVGGTLFVSGIDAAPADVQERLARWLDAAAPSGARLVAGSCRRLASLGLSAALTERIVPLAVEVPALADREDDLEPLVRTLLVRHAAASGVDAPEITSEFFAAIRGRAWPENVRDLKALVEHAAVVSHGAPLRPEHLPADGQPAAGPVEAATHHLTTAVREWAAAARTEFAGLPEPDLHHRTVRLVEATLLREALAHTGGNRTAAAKLLGLDRATLRTKLRQLGLDD